MLRMLKQVAYLLFNENDKLLGLNKKKISDNETKEKLIV